MQPRLSCYERILIGRGARQLAICTLHAGFECRGDGRCGAIGFRVPAGLRELGLKASIRLSRSRCLMARVNGLDAYLYAGGVCRGNITARLTVSPRVDAASSREAFIDVLGYAVGGGNAFQEARRIRVVAGRIIDVEPVCGGVALKPLHGYTPLRISVVDGGRKSIDVALKGAQVIPVPRRATGSRIIITGLSHGGTAAALRVAIPAKKLLEPRILEAGVEPRRPYPGGYVVVKITAGSGVKASTPIEVSGYGSSLRRRVSLACGTHSFEVMLPVRKPGSGVVRVRLGGDAVSIEGPGIPELFPVSRPFFTRPVIGEKTRIYLEIENPLPFAISAAVTPVICGARGRRRVHRVPPGKTVVEAAGICRGAERGIGVDIEYMGPGGVVFHRERHHRGLAPRPRIGVKRRGIRVSLEGGGIRVAVPVEVYVDHGVRVLVEAAVHGGAAASARVSRVVEPPGGLVELRLPLVDGYSLEKVFTELYGLVEGSGGAMAVRIGVHDKYSSYIFTRRLRGPTFSQ